MRNSYEDVSGNDNLKYLGWPKEEVEAYKKWRKQNYERLVKSNRENNFISAKRRTRNKYIRTNSNKYYAYYRRYFMSPNSQYDWEKKYNRMKDEMIRKTRAFALFSRKITKVVNMFGTKAEKERIAKVTQMEVFDK